MLFNIKLWTRVVLLLIILSTSRPRRVSVDAYRLARTRSADEILIETDIRKCFDRIDHDVLLALIGKVIPNDKLLDLISSAVKVRVALDEYVSPETRRGRGVPTRT